MKSWNNQMKAGNVQSNHVGDYFGNTHRDGDFYSGGGVVENISTIDWHNHHTHTGDDVENCPKRLKTVDRTGTGMVFRPLSNVDLNGGETSLLQLLSNSKWFESYIRCQSYPTECLPQLQSFGDEPIYHYTPLGIACRRFSVEKRGHDETAAMKMNVIKALCWKCPDQIRCDQMRVGRTPVLDAICNPNGNFELRKFMIDVDVHMDIDCKLPNRSTLKRVDCNGLSPLHHIIAQVHRNSTIAPEAGGLFPTIRYMLTIEPSLLDCYSDSHNQRSLISPLIHLLSHKAGLDTTDCVSKAQNVNACATMLLDAKPALIETKSIMTGCTALHMAFRNGYGYNKELISLLLSRDRHGFQMKTKNKFGDMPIHIAATLGIPREVMSMLLRHIIDHTSPSGLDSINGPNPYVWSLNGRGYSPIHLMWMRRKYRNQPYPMSYSRPIGMLYGCHKGQSSYYLELKNAIQDVSSSISLCRTSEDRAEVPTRILKEFWGLLLLFFQATEIHVDESKSMVESEEKCPLNLHAACSLMCPSFPNILIDLVLAVYPSQVFDIDQFGRTSLHYACACLTVLHKIGLNHFEENPNVSTITNEQADRLITLKSYSSEIISIICLLLSRNPGAASVSDNKSFLPIHFAIESQKRYGNLVSSTMHLGPQLDDSKRINEWASVVIKLCEAYPEALDIQDPINSFYPFMQAACAADSNGSLESIYTLLRMSPLRVID